MFNYLETEHSFIMIFRLVNNYTQIASISRTCYNWGIRLNRVRKNITDIVNIKEFGTVFEKNKLIINYRKVNMA